MKRIYSYKLHNRFLKLIHNYTKPDIFHIFMDFINIFNVFNKIHGETVLTSAKILKIVTQTAVTYYHYTIQIKCLHTCNYLNPWAHWDLPDDAQ